MAVEQHAGREEEQVAALLVAKAGTLLESQGTGAPKAFADALFGLSVPEDVVRYDVSEVAALAEAAWRFLAERKPGAPKIRLEAPAAAGEHLRSISVLEIINDDMPFLVDSVLGELAERGVEVLLVAHPVISVTRDAAGRVTSFGGTSNGAARRESVIHIHIGRIDDEARRGELVQGIAQVLADVRVSVHDWRSLIKRVEEVIAGLKSNPPPLPAEEVAEAAAFLEWLIANNFTLLGVRNYVFTANHDALEPRFETGLGLLRARDATALERGGRLVVTPEVRAALDEPQLLLVTKSTRRSRVHRHSHMDYIGVKLFDANGKLSGEFVIIGLFTSTTYTKSTATIPYLRRKVITVVKRAGFDPDGHSGKALVNVLETYPRDELFQIDENTLYRNALAILRLDEHPRVRVLPRRDRFGRFASVLVFVPRERYHSGARQAIGEYLANTYKGRLSAFFPFFPEGPLVRVHFIIGRIDATVPEPDRATLEGAVSGIVRSWTDGLMDALTVAHGPAARALFERYRKAFSQGYQEAYPPTDAVSDIRVIEGLSTAKPLSADFYRRVTDDGAGIGLKIWSHNRPIPLSERVPVLENMGFRVVDELTYRIAPGTPEEPDVWFHDMVLERANEAAADLASRKQALEACFIVVMTGVAESDGYNALVLTGGLAWRDVTLVRTISRFLRQIRVPYSQGYMWATLTSHPAIASSIVALFHLRFDPRLELSREARKTREAEAFTGIETALAKVESLDEDRILRHFVAAVQAAVRTTFYQLDRDGKPKALIAIKFASRKLDVVPLPRPLFEIFVYSPRVEGVHLRFGKVARGGIRWSDRPQDFRTEILGLVKAQQVKNAVIVPVGAKGGYVPKWLPGIVAAGGAREAVQAEGTAAYRLFISTLLDITDNLGAQGNVIAPPSVVRHDD